MALSRDERRQLLARSMPEAQAVRKELNDYMERTGLKVPDFARRINYSGISLYAFVRGDYSKISANDSAIRKAIRDFIQANPIGILSKEEGRLFKTEDFNILSEYFYKALDKAQAYFIYGPPGTQKSFLLKWLAADLIQREIAKDGAGKRAIYVYCRENIRPHDLLKRVAKAGGFSTVGNVDRILRNLAFDLRDRRSAICFDEAQHLSNQCLEVIRELLDEPPYCGLLFAGSHDLKKIFQQMELEQWRSRIHEGRALPGISKLEARDIICAELGNQPKKKIDSLVENARVPDPRQGTDFTYISARRLFWSIRDIKAALAERERLVS